MKYRIFQISYQQSWLYLHLGAAVGEHFVEAFLNLLGAEVVGVLGLVGFTKAHGQAGGGIRAASASSRR